MLAWGWQELRDLPWRRTRDPWSVLLSEVMLQQTGVDRVIAYYRRFLDRFPDAKTCADTPVAEVVRLWAGLGYNRRAVNLQRCATEVAERHGGELPADLDALLALPGVGPYTARAVLAFAFEQPVGVVDTNVGRVLARWAGRSLRPTEAQGLADGLVPPGDEWVWNQAIMELGATVCRPKQPDCTRCPVFDDCGWHAVELALPDPADGSAAVSQPQSPFDGSDRQGRGRLVDSLRAGPVPLDRLPLVMGWPDDPSRAAQVAEGLVADGLAVHHDATLRLPS